MTQRPGAVWRGPIGVAALAVVVIQVVWRAAYLGGSFWNQDDYYFLIRAADYGLTGEYLFLETAGHINPAQQFVVWMQDSLAPFGFWLAASTALAFQTLATIALWHLLSRLLPGAWARVPILALFAFAPLTLASTLWWAAMLALWPTLLLSIVSATFFLRWLQGARFGPMNAVASVLAYLGAFAFHERAVLVPVTLGALAVFESQRRTGARGWWRPIRDALLASRWFWGGVGALTAGLIVAHQVATELENAGGDLGGGAELSWFYLGRTTLPGLWGGPWVFDVVGGAVVPGFFGVVLGLVLTGVIAAAGRTFGGPQTAWAAAYVVVFVLTNLALLLVGRSGQGAIIALDPRYAADVPLAVAIALAVALRDPGWSRLRTRLPSPRASAAVATSVVVLSAAITTTQLAPRLQNDEDRRYFDEVRGALRSDPSIVLVDELVPPGILLPLYGDDSRASRVMARLPESPRFDLPSETLRILDETGVPQPVTLAEPVVSRPGPVSDCGYAIDEVRTIRLEEPVDVPGGRVVVRLDYFTNLASTGSVAIGDQRFDVGFSPGPHRVEAVVALEPGDTPDRIEVSVDDSGGSAVCVTSVEVGVPVRPY